MTIRVVLIVVILLGVGCQQQSTTEPMATAPETEPATAAETQPTTAPDGEPAPQTPPDTQAETRPAASPPPAAEPDEPIVRQPEVPGGLNKIVAIRNDPDAPLSEAGVSSVHAAFRASGCTIVDSLDCELLVMCSAPERQWASGRAPDEVVYLVETNIVPGDTALRTPPDWAPRVPDIRWQALVNFELASWQTRGAEAWTMPVVTINLGRRGLNHPDFDRRDLERLQELAQNWATQEPWRSNRRR